jgi:PAS domain S-box-containing protein
MAKPAHSPLLRYGVAVGVTALAALLRWALEPVIGNDFPFITFFLGVAFSAWYGGLGPGLFATLLASFISLYGWLPPEHTLLIHDRTTAIGLFTFLLICSAISALSEAMHRARRRVEENAAALSESRRLLAITLGSIGDAVIATDTAERVTFINPVAESLTGWTRGEAIGRPIKEVFRIVNEATREPVESPVDKVLREGRIVGLANHTVLIRKDGSDVPIDDSGAPIRDDAGRLSGVVLVFRNISERRRVEEALGFVASIVESSEDAIIGKRLDGTIVSWNAGAEHLYGYRAEEVVGRHIRLLTDPEQDDIDRIMEELRAGNRVHHYETVRVKKNGERVDVALTISPIKGPNGTLTGASTIARDISERKRAERERERLLAEIEASERRARFLAEASAVLASSLDYQATLRGVAQQAVPHLADWCVVHVSEDGQTFKQLAIRHADPEKSAFAEEAGEQYPPDPDAQVGVPNVLRTGRSEFYPRVDDAVLVQFARGEEHLRILRESNLRSAMFVPLVARNRPLGVMTFIASDCHPPYTPADLELAEDLARRAALAVDNAMLFAESNRARAIAEEANRLKDEFLATVSHELRTPLNAIVGWSHMLRNRRFDPPTTARALETIERNAKMQAQIVEDILDVSRIITGKLRLDVQPVDLASVIEAALDSVRPAADAKEIRLQATLDPHTLPVPGDPNRLQQVVWNLLSNAVKFTPRGGQVEVRLRQSDSHAEIVVTDTGQGITGELLPFVFDRFRQGDSTSTRLHGGLGLGLAIVRHLVELHGGTVTAESAGADRGAVFTVRLPLMALHSESYGAERTAITSPTLTSSEHAPDLSGLRVLVVDDEPDTREMLRIMIERFGAQVRVCASSREAVGVFQEWPPDIIVSDIEMPGEDGYQLMRQIRDLAPTRGGTTPAVALTAYARAEDRARAISAGYQMHVAKPADPVELALAIARLASRRNGSDE